METIISKGRDLKEAISLGMGLLETTKKDVSIEILQQETKGFLGFGAKQAIVKLTKLKDSNKHTETFHELLEKIDLNEQINSILPKEIAQIEQLDITKEVQDNLDLGGKVWLKDGKLYSKSSPTHFPMVTIYDGITLFEDGNRVTEKTIIIKENTFYEIMIDCEEKETIWEVEMDAEKLKVFLHVEPGYKLFRKIPDMEPDSHIELRIEEEQVFQNKLDYAEVIKKLETLRVIQGFNYNEIQKAIETIKPGKFEIVTGVPAKEGRDGWLDIRVDMNTSVGPKEIEGDRVDFRETNPIPTVKRGEVIAIINLPVPGECGYTVTNEPYPAKQTFPIVVHAGRGIEIIEDKIVAAVSGRPHIQMRGLLVKVEIMPKLIHSSDVNLASGNIHFMGDVEVLGEVGERMVVESGGDILVHKSVNMATLTASGAIVSKGTIVSSEIAAGKSNMLVSELGQLLNTLHQHIEKMIVVIKQLSLSTALKDNNFTKVGIQPLIRILLDKKFQSFTSFAKSYVEVVRRSGDHLTESEWGEISTSLTKHFLSLTNEVTSLEHIIRLSQKIKTQYEFSKTPVEPNSSLTIPSVFNSRLYCSGNIFILGQGCVNSKIHAGGIVKITGIIRGGEVYGRLGAEINETGAERGTPTFIAVSYGEKIKINKAMEGTTVKIGNVKYTFTETRYQVTVRLNENGRIIIH